jgi:type II secretory pathway component GspD/PulD (secretin)
LISNIQYQDVSLRLDVSPLIMSDDEIMLQVKQVNASIAGTTVISGNPIPNISQQGLDTTITLRSGSTVLLGGLISESVDRQRNGIPILKDIPIIKYLASSMKNEKQTRELLVFINPRVITGNGDDPPSPTDAAGNSPLGDDMKKFLSTERDDPDTARTEIKRSRAATFFRRFFK